MKPIVASRQFARERFALTLIIALCAFFHSCRKPNDPGLPHVPPSPGTKVGQLKEIVVANLPNPYYHFDYTDDGVTTDISFGSSFYIYKLSYVNGRLDKMVNLPNNNSLLYEYSNGKVSSIRERRLNQTYVQHYTIDYDNDQVSEIRYYLSKVSGADSILWKKVLFFYNNDGNLDRYEKYIDITGQNLQWDITEKYSEYDNGKNVDGFRHYKDFFDHVLYLPGVRFMKNNPHKILVTTTLTDYEITDAWTYQNGLPVSKQSHFKQTRGANAGQELDGSTTFSYY